MREREKERNQITPLMFVAECALIFQVEQTQLKSAMATNWDDISILSIFDMHRINKLIAWTFDKIRALIIIMKKLP